MDGLSEAENHSCPSRNFSSVFKTANTRSLLSSATTVSPFLNIGALEMGKVLSGELAKLILIQTLQLHQQVLALG